MLAELQTPLEACVVMEVPEDELVRRLRERASIEGRSDDDEETIRRRMEVYRRQTEPLVDYYRERGLVRRVDALGTIDEVEKRIEEALV
jgi:adenylate kinase